MRYYENSIDRSIGECYYINMNTNTMTFEEYAEKQDWLSTHFGEAALDTEATFHAVLTQARREGIKIVDEVTVDFDAVVWDLYSRTAQ